jgi:hypothetical protein
MPPATALAYCCPVCRVRYPLGSYECRGGWPDRNPGAPLPTTHPPTLVVPIPGIARRLVTMCAVHTVPGREHEMFPSLEPGCPTCRADAAEQSARLRDTRFEVDRDSVPTPRADGSMPAPHLRRVSLDVDDPPVITSTLAGLAMYLTARYKPTGDREIHAGDRVTVIIPGREPITAIVVRVQDAGSRGERLLTFDRAE